MTDELALALPNCSHCLVPLDVQDTDEHPYLQCLECGEISISV